jgi:hypothetical protein
MAEAGADVDDCRSREGMRRGRRFKPVDPRLLVERIHALQEVVGD